MANNKKRNSSESLKQITAHRLCIYSRKLNKTETLTFYPERRDTDGEANDNNDDENEQEDETATHRPFLCRQRQLAL